MPSKLNSESIDEHLKKLPGWSVNSAGELEREFRFETYKDGLVFAVAVGFLADAMDHHPDLTVSYQKVKVSVSTHSAGGLTDLDFSLASKVSAIVA